MLASKKSVEQQAAGWRNAKKNNPRKLGPLVALRQHATYGCTFCNTTQRFGRTISEGAGNLRHVTHISLQEVRTVAAPN
ncbi:MAG: hypothetical protein DMG30_11910 [Acidobacteria bacterium]|nr:MAG: hypothetical protein DMG30_11910 [Acidobacteriota bacterium]